MVIAERQRFYFLFCLFHISCSYLAHHELKSVCIIILIIIISIIIIFIIIIIIIIIIINFILLLLLLSHLRVPWQPDQHSE